jgi:hypothetical protein
MTKKTVVKRLCKWLPRSPELQRALEKDEPDYIDLSQPGTAALQDVSGQGAIETTPASRPDPTTARRPGRPRKADAGIFGAAAVETPTPTQEATTPAPEVAKEQPTVAAEESAPTPDEPEVPKRTAIAKGEQLSGRLKIVSITEEFPVQADGTKKRRFKLEVERAYWGTAYSYCVNELEGKTGETVDVHMLGKLYGGQPHPCITDVLKPDSE